MKQQTILQAKGLHKTFKGVNPLQILKGVDLNIYSGESVAIMGRSGEGKSTLLHILGSLDNPTEGSIRIHGHEVSSWNRNQLRSQEFGFIFQSFHLLEDFSVAENILMPAKIARKRTSQGSVPHQRSATLIDQVGLSGRHQTLTKLLSGGEKQRVAIARALMNEPTLLFADEPTGNLDRQTALQIEDILFDTCKEQCSLVIVTHDENLASRCDRRFELVEGKLNQIK